MKGEITQKWGSVPISYEKLDRSGDYVTVFSYFTFKFDSF